VIEAKYQDQSDLSESKSDMDDYRAWHDDMALDFFEIRKELILDVLLVD
jgi:hypothetical protein